MVGKRGRPPMKRTTSMTEFTLDLNGRAVVQLYQPSDPHNPFNDDLNQHYMASAAAAPRLQRRKIRRITFKLLPICPTSGGASRSSCSPTPPVPPPPTEDPHLFSPVLNSGAETSTDPNRPRRGARGKTRRV